MNSSLRDGCCDFRLLISYLMPQQGAELLRLTAEPFSRLSRQMYDPGTQYHGSTGRSLPLRLWLQTTSPAARWPHTYLGYFTDTDYVTLGSVKVVHQGDIKVNILSMSLAELMQTTSALLTRAAARHRPPPNRLRLGVADFHLCCLRWTLKPLHCTTEELTVQWNRMDDITREWCREGSCLEWRTSNISGTFLHSDDKKKKKI